MTPTKKLLKFLDLHLMEITAGFLLAFIPLYPKWPLFDVLPGYIVRVRLDDFVILTALILLSIQVIRRKVNLKSNPLFWPILIYLSIGLASVLSALFITRTVPLELSHVGKLLLHYGRRVEYTSVALIFAAAVNSKHSLKRLLIVFVITAGLVSLYGFGQKYLSWPVYSTMNREFAKGWRLVLTPHARVSSTFAGHYDLAAYAIVATSASAALALVSKSKTKLISIVIFILSFATLLLTASRSSFLAYLPAITLVCVLLARAMGIKKAIASWLVIMFISAVGFTTFGSLYSRFAHILRLDRVHNYIVDLTSNFKPSPSKDLEISYDLALVYTETDTPPSPVASPAPDLANLPPDVYEDIPETFPEASLSAIPSDSEPKSRTYSDSAYTYGLSGAIRFDVLWPKAFSAFTKNPLLGTGYSTLLKDHVTDFTEAESTDNDFLRTLGETGLLGFISLYGIFAYALYLTLKRLPSASDIYTQAFMAAFVGSLIGLLINALYIDVFVASKVAYTTWAFIGMAAGLSVIIKPPKRSSKKL